MTKIFLKKKDVAEIVGRNVRTIDRWISEGFFPRGRFIKGAMTWTQKDIEKWYESLPVELAKKYSAA